VIPEIGGDAWSAGELRYVGVQIHAVDGLQFVADVFLLEIGERTSHDDGGVRLGICYTIQAKAQNFTLHLAWSEATPR